MKEPEGRYIDFLKLLTCPAGGAALDWASGLLLVDRAFSSEHEFRSFLQTPGQSEKDRELVLALTHEFFHFVQVATMGWPYAWACKLDETVTYAFRGIGDNIETWSGFLFTLKSRFPDVARRRLTELDGELREPGPNSLSVLDLLESQAFLVESRVHYRGLNATQYVSLMNSKCPGRCYRRAYDVARYRLGDRQAFELFSALVSASLCTRDPAYAFDFLLDVAHFRTGSARDVFEFASSLPPECLLGTSVEVREKEALSHPIYDPALLEITNVLCPAGFDVQRFFSQPHLELEALMSLQRPTVYSGTIKGERLITIPKEMNENDLWKAIFVGSVFSSVMKVSVRVAALQPDPLAWVERVEPNVLAVSVSPEYLGKCDTSCLDAFRMERTAREHDLLVPRWGRTLLSFDIKEGDYIWTRDDVRSFIRALHIVNPAFPIFFFLDPRLGMGGLWYGSLADRSAFRGDRGAFEIDHRSLWPFFEKTLRAVLSLGEARGWDMRLPIAQILSVLPSETRRELLSAIGFQPPRALRSGPIE